MIEFVTLNPPGLISGIGRYHRELYEHLKDRVDIRMAFPRFPPLSDRFTVLRNFPMGIIDHQPGNIVHFTQIMGCALMLYRPYHPSIATVHDLGVLELPEEWDMFDPLARQILRLSFAGLKRVDRIIADSEFTRQGVIKHLRIPAERVATIHLGIDHQLFKPIPNARQALINRFPLLAKDINKPWLLYVGSEIPRKNFKVLLQALNLLRETIPNIKLIKVGAAGGKHFRQETLRVIKELDLQDQVLFFDNVTENELSLFYNAADIFITASKLEGFGFPVLEAMACGLPVICSNSGSLPEIVGNAAIMHQPQYIKSFAKSVCLVYEDTSLRDQLIMKGKKQVENFSWGLTSKEMIRSYQNIIQ